MIKVFILMFVYINKLLDLNKKVLLALFRITFIFFIVMLTASLMSKNIILFYGFKTHLSYTIINITIFSIASSLSVLYSPSLLGLANRDINDFINKLKKPQFK